MLLFCEQLGTFAIAIIIVFLGLEQVGLVDNMIIAKMEEATEKGRFHFEVANCKFI